MLKLKRSAIAVALSMPVMALAACGDSSTVEGESAAGNGVDRAFVAEMVPHHRSAVEMAEIAQERSERPEIQELADAIIESQNAEIEAMEGIEGDLAEADVEAGDLGIEHEDMGMDMDAAMLEDAEPFEREFVDMMIPHHQGAIRMAEVALAEGESAEVKELANAIIDAQANEIDDMNSWRVEWYGEISPAGGVPEDGDDADDGHSG